MLLRGLMGGWLVMVGVVVSGWESRRQKVMTSIKLFFFGGGLLNSNGLEIWKCGSWVWSAEQKFYVSMLFVTCGRSML